MFRALHPNIRTRIIINFLSKIIASMIFSVFSHLFYTLF
ncbi:hypothetical protein MCOL2_05363 [Listeria fleischmannii FSL S10-1203]|uniref:Uncharacterized protein n=1 Tax=Listeria fleischmannii FSL S10-1203 TaxID=1265822 RepID=W7E0S1_9LIST|nr:hypothetical protein MCOL2_05363 [Listeria fleischmannii FSL S10-1203]